MENPLTHHACMWTHARGTHAQLDTTLCWIVLLKTLLADFVTPHVSECVAEAVSCTHHPKNPKLGLTAASDLVCSLVILLQRSLWESVHPRASAALSLRSAVLWLAFTSA